jgi:hypothetical protein
MAQRFYISQWMIPSTSGRVDKQGNAVMYKISEAQDGHFECSCPAWKFRRHLVGDCKHIIAIRANRGRIEEAMTQRQTVRIEHDEQIITIEDGRITGFLEFLGTHRADRPRPPVHIH